MKNHSLIGQPLNKHMSPHNNWVQFQKGDMLRMPRLWIRNLEPAISKDSASCPKRGIGVKIERIRGFQRIVSDKRPAIIES